MRELKKIPEWETHSQLSEEIEKLLKLRASSSAASPADLLRARIKALSTDFLNQHMVVLQIPERSSEALQRDKLWQSRLVFPGIGRRLTEQDIGQYILRTMPFAHSSSDGIPVYDGSYLPDGKKLKDYERMKLVALNVDGTLTYRNRFSDSKISKEMANDPHWVTEREFTEYLANSPDGAVPFGSLPQYISSSSSSVISRMSFSKYTLKSLRSPAVATASSAAEVVVEPEIIPMEQFSLREFGVTDYAFLPPQPVEMAAAATSASVEEPNFSSKNPYKILGLVEGETNAEVIKKRYKTLALQFHPDRKSAQRDRECFQKIQASYEKLMAEQLVLSFAYDDQKEPEELFLEATDYRNFLGRKGIAFSEKKISELLPAYIIFAKELKRVNPNAAEDPIIRLNFRNLIHQISSFVWFYETKNSILSIKLPGPMLPNHEKIVIIQHHLQTLRQIDIRLPERSENIFYMLDSVSATILDKYIALSRSMAELLIQEKKSMELATLRLDVLTFEGDHNSRKATIVKQLQQQERAIIAETERLNPNPSKRNKSEENVEASEEKVDVSDDAVDFPKQQASDTKSFNWPKEIAALHANIKENIRFFRTMQTQKLQNQVLRKWEKI